MTKESEVRRDRCKKIQGEGETLRTVVRKRQNKDGKREMQMTGKGENV